MFWLVKVSKRGAKWPPVSTSAARYVRSYDDDEGLQLNDKVGGYECVNWSFGEMKKLKFTVQHLRGTS